MNIQSRTVPIPQLLRILQPIDFPYKLGICDRLFGKTLAAKGICWVDTAATLRWKLDLLNPTHRWIAYGNYEGSGFIKWAKRFLPRNGVVVDSGANIGQMALYLAQWVPKGKVLAFEPGEEQVNWLIECLNVNANLPVEVIQFALGATPSFLYLKDAGEKAKHGANDYISETDGNSVRVVTLSDELKARSIKKVHLWKLDVEGYELAALQGAHEFLEDQLISAIYAELGAGSQKTICNYLAEFGYICYSLAFSGKPKKAVKISNLGMGLFLPNGSRRKRGG
jgi:FkbM family methyltransferase